MSRELLEKLQCLYENLMSNNFRKNGCSEKNNYELYTKATQQWILPTNLVAIIVLKFLQMLVLDFPYIFSAIFIVPGKF